VLEEPTADWDAVCDADPVDQATWPRPIPAARATTAALPTSARWRGRCDRRGAGGGGVSYGSNVTSVIAVPPSTASPWRRVMVIGTDPDKCPVRKPYE
jgi:hypothetical protein